MGMNPLQSVRPRWGMVILCCVIGMSAASVGAAGQVSYAIVSSKSTAAEPEWQAVIEALAQKYPGAEQLTFADGELPSLLGSLRASRPRYACIVAPHAEVTREFVSQVHQLSRRIKRVLASQ